MIRPADFEACGDRTYCDNGGHWFAARDGLLKDVEGCGSDIFCLECAELCALDPAGCDVTEEQAASLTRALEAHHHLFGDRAEAGR
ncbi:MAG: hypothetical protein MH204_10250 [Fimbriimonadaceae bacterium]|nr:hypothetical protein [Fimbriimonadaceae bacterium]